MTRHSQQRAFFMLLATQTLSLIGSRMTAVAVGIWLYRNTGLTTPLLLAAFFRETPGLVMGAVAGVWVDRWDRKWVIVLADLGQALGSLILLWAFRSGSFRPACLYGVALVQGMFAILQSPAVSATVSLLAHDQQRDRANGLLELSFPLAGIVAPALVGMSYPRVGVEGIVALDLGSFALAALIMSPMHIPRPPHTAHGQPESGRWLAELREGWFFFAKRKPLLQFVLYQAFMWFAVNGPLELAVPYVMSITGSEQQVGRTMSLMSTGALIGGLVVSAVGSFRPRIRAIAVGMLLTGLMFLAYGTAQSAPLLAISIFLLMIPLPISNALLRSVIQAKTPPDLQGRAFAAMDQLFLMGSTSSFLLTGPLVDRLLTPSLASPKLRWLLSLSGRGQEAGMRLVLITAGVLILTATTLMLGRNSIRNLEKLVPDFVPDV